MAAHANLLRHALALVLVASLVLVQPALGAGGRLGQALGSLKGQSSGKAALRRGTAPQGPLRGKPLSGGGNQRMTPGQVRSNGPRSAPSSPAPRAPMPVVNQTPVNQTPVVNQASGAPATPVAMPPAKPAPAQVVDAPAPEPAPVIPTAATAAATARVAGEPAAVSDDAPGAGGVAPGQAGLPADEPLSDEPLSDEPLSDEPAIAERAAPSEHELEMVSEYYTANFGGFKGIRGSVVPVLPEAPEASNGVDLIVENIEKFQDATLIAGPAYLVTFRNQGIAPAERFVVALVASTDGKVSDDAPRVALEVPSLAAGETRQLTLRLPKVEFSHLIVIVDATHVVEEFDETNNGATVERSSL